MDFKCALWSEKCNKHFVFCCSFATPLIQTTSLKQTHKNNYVLQQAVLRGSHAKIPMKLVLPILLKLLHCSTITWDLH